MSYRRGAGALAIAGALVSHQVNIEFAEFGPAQLDVLPAETVAWTNVSTRQHTVTSDVGAFGSALLSSGDRFNWTFAAVGAYPYHCTVHAGMTGEVDVRRVTLAPLPTAVLRPGTLVELSGRTVEPLAPVRIEHSADGTHFTTEATTTPTTGGDWNATVNVRATADYRATSGPDASEIRRLLVSSSRVKVRATRAGVAVRVTPKAPYDAPAPRSRALRMVADRAQAPRLPVEGEVPSAASRTRASSTGRHRRLDTPRDQPRHPPQALDDARRQVALPH
jgi:plastocyanin